MNSITFNYNTNAIRTQVTDEGEPLFCLADVCKVLDGNQPNKVAEAIREEFGCPELNSAHVVDSLGREQEATFITEPQLYFVLMRYDRIWAAACLLEHGILKAINQGDLD